VALFARAVLAVAWIGAMVAPVYADIWVWRDAGGAEHFTNSPEGVPPDRRSEATLFVRERPRAAPLPAVVPAAVETAAPVAVAEREPIEDDLARAFAAGIEAAAGAGVGASPEVVPATVVQNTEVVVEAPTRETILVGGFARPFPARRPSREPHPRGGSPRGDFVVGPAGPPPVGAPGPAPIELR
jgi:hypothetical protein